MNKEHSKGRVQPEESQMKLPLLIMYLQMCEYLLGKKTVTSVKCELTTAIIIKYVQCVTNA